MGTWGANLFSGDAELDMTADFFTTYNDGATPLDAAHALVKDVPFTETALSEYLRKVHE